ncbi:hypothetical protein PVAP13_5NG275480 [Panicum virgatum]|uniref:Uncharacterized protein n=1 Tax=Panicum virgatum TaxID=38727 RepID=A0A8T0RWL0_PANVG|nr:hypothetical protein PVAP13_5NG275480 [Panicum virgatum]
MEMEEPTPRFFSDIFPENHADLSWVLDGMNPNSSYRLAVRVGAARVDLLNGEEQGEHTVIMSFCLSKMLI